MQRSRKPRFLSALLWSVLVVGGAMFGPALLGAGPAAHAAGPAHAAKTDVDDFTFSSFDGDYTVSKGAGGVAELRAVETFVAEFPDFEQNKGIIRAIPDVFNGAPLDTKIVSVTDENGMAVQWDADKGGDFIELALGTDDYVTGTHTYVITYTQRNVVGAYQDTHADEFYWDAPGNGYGQPFASAAMTVHIAPDITGSLTGNAACYRGSQGDTARCDIANGTDGAAGTDGTNGTDSADGTNTSSSPDAGSVFTVSPVPLQPHQTLTVAIGFRPGTFTQPERPRDSPVFTAVPVGLAGLSAAGVITLGVIRFRKWRDHPGRGTIIAEYSVPKDLNLLMAGDLIGRASSSMAATIVSLAVRGNLRILDYAVTEEGAKTAKRGKSFSLQYLNADGTDEQEQAVLAMLFPDEDEPIREMGVVDTALGTAVTAELARVKTLAVERGFRRNVSSVVSWLIVVVLAAVGIGSFVFQGIAGDVHASSGTTVFAMLACGAAVFIGVVLAIAPHPLTAAGAERRDYLEGMRVYLKLAEADRFRMLQSPDGAERIDVGDPGQVVKLYEKLLPFAVLWGVERDWVKELSIHYEQIGVTPGWYASDRPFAAAAFADSFSGFSGEAASSTASWSSSGGASSSGGSMGGGFAGGGGGGGGGGGR
ncbi:DUF2207 domain-containing protein [Plantibacter sp. YIM 135249]|uniref:DUF2207 domain-containing protein n=1 Tax=Plantibacter sp. YIM 135249 TaxID=3423918 RepID=UPI003D33AD91